MGSPVRADSTAAFNFAAGLADSMAHYANQRRPQCQERTKILDNISIDIGRYRGLGERKSMAISDKIQVFGRALTNRLTPVYMLESSEASAGIAKRVESKNNGF